VARLPEAELARRAERDAAAGPAAGGRRRTARQAASRRARVARSRRAEGHDHDHDHDDEVVAEDAVIDESSPYAGSVVADESGEAPEGFEIKGNEDSKKYHVPGSQWYDQTQPEVWFATADDAEAAGFVPAGGEAAQDVDDEPEADEPAGSVDDAIEAQNEAEPTDVDATADGDTDSPEDAAAEDDKKDED
jgi:hypothetical protein